MIPPENDKPDALAETDEPAAASENDAPTHEQPDKPLDEVGEASRESFPASDPPSYNPGHA